MLHKPFIIDSRMTPASAIVMEMINDKKEASRLDETDHSRMMNGKLTTIDDWNENEEVYVDGHKEVETCDQKAKSRI